LRGGGRRKGSLVYEGRGASRTRGRLPFSVEDGMGGRRGLEKGGTQGSSGLMWAKGGTAYPKLVGGSGEYMILWKKTI